MSFKSGKVSIVDDAITIIRHPTTAFSDISGGYDTTTLPTPLTGGDADEVKITPDSTVEGTDYFGSALGIGSGVAVILSSNDELGGSPGGATGVGSAYLYRNISGPIGWGSGNFIKRLEAPDAAASDQLFVADVGCGRVVAGAIGNDDYYSGMGAAYIWDTNGNFIRKILPIDVTQFTSGQAFGRQVAVGNGRIAVTAGSGFRKLYIYDLNGNGMAIVDPPISFCNSIAIGCGMIAGGFGLVSKVVIYDLNGNERAVLNQPSGYSGGGFGSDIAIGAGRLVIGNADANTGQGAVHVWKIDESSDFSATPDFTITSPNPSNYNYFGGSVAVGDGRIVIGEYGLSSSRGRAYVYDLDGNLITALSAYDGSSTDYYGRHVAIGGGKILISATLEDESGTNAGSVYCYDTPMQTHYLDFDKHATFT